MCESICWIAMGEEQWIAERSERGRIILFIN
jgi:hypothetical protein